MSLPLRFFESLVEGRIPYAKDENGFVFVDRSGDLFAVLLNFARTTQRPPQSLVQRYVDQLLEECAYFGLQSLALMIRGQTCPLDLRPQDRSIREQEAMAREQPRAFEKEMLIDVFTADLTFLGRDELQLPLLLQSLPPPAMQASSIAVFQERLNNFSGQLLQELTGIDGLIFAGGAILGALTGVASGDLDIFLNVPLSRCKEILKQIYAAVQRNQARISKQRLLITRSRHAITFYRTASNKIANPPVQVMRP